jgi:hypothetical protein
VQRVSAKMQLHDLIIVVPNFSIRPAFVSLETLGRRKWAKEGHTNIGYKLDKCCEIKQFNAKKELAKISPANQF